jgi:hypothetical protein
LVPSGQRLLLRRAGSTKLIGVCTGADSVAAFHFGYAAARQAELAAMIRAGIDAGEIATSLDVDLAVVLLLGPLFSLG